MAPSGAFVDQVRAKHRDSFPIEVTFDARREVYTDPAPVLLCGSDAPSSQGHQAH